MTKQLHSAPEEAYFTVLVTDLFSMQAHNSMTAAYNGSPVWQMWGPVGDGGEALTEDGVGSIHRVLLLREMKRNSPNAGVRMVAAGCAEGGRLPNAATQKTRDGNSNLHHRRDRRRTGRAHR